MIKIYHNQRCRKSRSTLEILQNSDVDLEVVDYQTNPPSVAELKEILGMLNMKPLDLIRKGEEIYKANFKGKELSELEWIEAMVQYPKLIERPIVLNNGKAIIGRPPENVNKIL